MNIIEFITYFPDEESCEIFLKTYRENSGIYCKTCKCFPKQYWYSGSKFFECSKCRRRTSLKAGTVVEASNLSLHIWFTAFLLMSATKKGFSCLEFQRQLGLKRYETAFNLMHKIRAIMGKRDDLYLLKGMVEYDEAYVEKATKKVVQERLKRGKGSQKQAIVAVASESTPLEDPLSGKMSSHCGFLKMKALGDVTRESVEEFVKESIDSKSALFTDKNAAYVNLEKMVEQHIKVKSTSESTNGALNWVHTAISNLKKNLLGIYHMVSEKYLQNYLNEFTYKLNRRYFGEKLFNRLIIASVYPYVQHCE
ncbi:IS1595-like element ISAhi1 family transposase [Algoriphagus hitonicola]|uniref:ISXO2-like transposase domain-containing protein n=1 Tax=Algoriphagus hitonicola TaxID=435880 RepID=A0A1I2XD54_9BACT|nr:IS1595-like element ISAhi1 family transposase [Algoriphagus hitonicola]SFH11395.1 ISXO2-like transposase domain-containing protein [Algoriphagus hitonicola]